MHRKLTILSVWLITMMSQPNYIVVDVVVVIVVVVLALLVVADHTIFSCHQLMLCWGSQRLLLSFCGGGVGFAKSFLCPTQPLCWGCATLCCGWGCDKLDRVFVKHFLRDIFNISCKIYSISPCGFLVGNNPTSP